jgi:uncharacterized DUF497 family protein
MLFDWDAANTTHIARHGIAPGEAEQALKIDPLIADIQEHEGEQRFLCFGRTRSGRMLVVLYTEREGKVRVVTAYPMTKQQERVYFEGK